MTAGTLEDAVAACKISLSCFKEEPVIVNFGGGKEADELLQQLPGMEHARISHCALPDVPELEVQGIYGEVIMEKQQWKSRIKDQVKQILKEKPEAVYVEGDVFLTYPVVHQLRKKHIPVLTRWNGMESIISCASRPGRKSFTIIKFYMFSEDGAVCFHQQAAPLRSRSPF